MKKELPKPKKTIKTFILDEDAKVIDKTAMKVAITGSFLALGIVANTQDVSAAQGGCDHTNHENHLSQFNKTDSQNLMPDGDEVSYHNVTNNQGNDNVDYSRDYKAGECDKKTYELEFERPAKSVGAGHANHYNHENGGGQSG